MFQRGAGGVVTDVAGREYVDFVLGYGSVILGHAVPSFLDGVQRCLQYGTMLPGYTSWHTELLTKLLGAKMEASSSAFFKTGSESTTAAIRLAAKISGRKGVVRCGFLGWHDAQLGLSPRWHESLASPLRTQLRYTSGFRGVSNDEEVFNWTSLDVDELRSIIRDHGHKIGCFLFDTYQLRFAGAETLTAALNLCKENEIYVVADETKIAGRVSRLGFAADMAWDVDFTVMGKAIANGAPLSLLIGRPSLMDASEDVRITGTFSQELGAVFSALVTLEEMEASAGYEVVRSVGNRVCNAFNHASQAFQLHDVVRAEPIFGGALFELVFSNDLLPNWDRRQSLCTQLAAHGVLLLQGHPSYVCREHQSMNYSSLRNAFDNALRQWRASA